NTTMLHLLTGLEVTSLGVSPFTPVTLFGETRPAASVLDGLPNAELYLPPGISTYVGPDITCGLVATGLGSAGRPELLVDLGTNGEMAFSANGRLWCCATAAGPAFEGAEISSGMPALPGAIEDVFVDGDDVGFSTIEHKRPKGVCGTGLIAAVNAWLDLDLVDSSGAMSAESLRIGSSEISLTRADVRMLQLAKAAVAAGIDTLLSEAGLTPSDVATLNLAGGFGSYLQAGPAIGIGLLPAATADCVTPAGNSALSGAVLLTLSTAARRAAQQRADEAIEVSLATHPVFMDRYIEDMTFRDDDA
ncbi:MAG: ASKHA domain-containing protein, partial [Propionibacteriaceae bacterium]|nr:ASKHA domain-containing protein [Propionibacteriaceae bacterium]